MNYSEHPIPHYEFLNNDRCIVGFSTRKGGVSKNVYESLNLGLHSIDNQENVQENRLRFFSAVAPDFEVKNLHQIHSADVVCVDSQFANDTQADGFYTTERGVLLTVSIADCGSVLFVDNNFSIIAGLHCGWRGTQLGIIQNMVEKLSQFVNPQMLTAFVGPMILQENYEVGEEFLSYFPQQFFAKMNNSLRFDLNASVDSILHDCGVGKIVNPKIDTYGNPEEFFSYRRDGKTGRMCAYIGLI